MPRWGPPRRVMAIAGHHTAGHHTGRCIAVRIRLSRVRVGTLGCATPAKPASGGSALWSKVLGIALLVGLMQLGALVWPAAPASLGSIAKRHWPDRSIGLELLVATSLDASFDCCASAWGVAIKARTTIGNQDATLCRLSMRRFPTHERLLAALQNAILSTGLSAEQAFLTGCPHLVH
jgi:hypothetical protein